jgi:hypothetical protein
MQLQDAIDETLKYDLMITMGDFNAQIFNDRTGKAYKAPFASGKVTSNNGNVRILPFQ